MWTCDHTHAGVLDMEGDKEEGGDSGGVPMPAGLTLMDVLAWSTSRNKERKVFFSHRRRCAAAETGRGRAVYPAAQFPCYLSHCFFPPAYSPAGAATAQKGWRTVKPQKPGLQSGVCHL